MKGRPRLDVGTYGKIRTRQTGDRWQAIAQRRDEDGHTRQYARAGDTEAKATRALRLFFAAKSSHYSGGDITPDTRMSDLAEEYFRRLERHVADGARSPNTVRLYRGHWDNHIKPAVAGLSIAEADVQCLDTLLVALRERGYGAELRKTVRAVLSGMMGVAVRRKAIPTNPVRDLEDITGSKRAKVRALEPAEAVDLWQRLIELSRMPGEEVNGRRYRKTLIDPDLPDLVLWMLGTSERIGQAIAVHWPWLDLDAATAALGPNVIRVKGEGLRLNWGTTKTRDRVLDLPEPVMAMLLLRREVADNPMGPVFPDALGGLRDPSNTSADLRRALDLAGYDWVRSHVFRKTVATVLDDAGLSARHVADQLGHARPSMTQDKYMARTARNPRAREAIEAMLSTEPERRVVSMKCSG